MYEETIIAFNVHLEESKKVNDTTLAIYVHKLDVFYASANSMSRFSMRSRFT